MMGDLQIVGGVKKLNNQNYNMWAILMESYLQGQDLWEIIRGNNVKPPTDDATLKKWNINIGNAMFIIKSQHKKKVKTSKEASDTFAMIFSRKNNTRLQLLKNEPLSVSRQDMTINEYFNKIKFLSYEISELDHTATIFEFRIKRIIVHSSRLEFRSFLQLSKIGQLNQLLRNLKSCLPIKKQLTSKQVEPQ